ncbi:MAG: serpin family protein [Myxococcales bacterium]|nr:serpin family protein [Myxococcales bacterium]
MKKRAACLSWWLLLACGGTTPTNEPAVPAPIEPTEEPTEEPTTERPTQPTEGEVTAGDFAPVSPQELTALARANQFGFDLYGALRGAPGNLVFSPASVDLALGMTYLGARGETAAQMGRVLHTETAEGLARLHGTAIRTWGETRDATLRIANRIYVEQTVSPEPSFVALTRDAYLAPLHPLSFITEADAARVTINTWVAERTEQRIRDLLPERSLDSLTRLVLVNAIYFKGTWQTQFEESRTQPRTFHLGGGRTASVNMMHTKERFAWARVPSDGLRVLEMPYAGEELSMVWLLPEDRDGLGALEEKLSAEAFARWRAAARPVEVEVQIPRFRMEPPTIALSDTLKRGMPLAFSRAADFTGIATLPDGLYIQEVFHKAFIEVNEEGTEAAAATAVVMATRGAPGPSPEVPRFIADHPFLFALVDRRTGVILFLGRVVDPR